MKIFIIGIVMIALLTLMVAFPPTAEPTEKIIVPARVYSGDTLNSVCSRAALEHGDVRDDLRAITYGTKRLNNMQGDDIYTGDILLVELEVRKE